MKFEIFCESGTKPPNAVIEHRSFWRKNRIFKSITKYFSSSDDNPWFKEGRNHQKNADGSWSRELLRQETFYSVEFETLQDFVNYVNEIDEKVIVDTQWSESEIPTLRIYDEYIE